MFDPSSELQFARVLCERRFFEGTPRDPVSLSMLSGKNWVTVSSLRVFGEIDTESSEAIACDMEELS